MQEFFVENQVGISDRVAQKLSLSRRGKGTMTQVKPDGILLIIFGSGIISPL
jgi:hypothetical protein